MEVKMKPKIGITMSEDTEEQVILTNYYFRAVEKAGGLPLLLPSMKDLEAISQLANLLDGLILSGGVDVDPMHIGQEPVPELGRLSPERDEFELNLTRQALKKCIPILGICRGVQLLNIAAGGTIYQDINTQMQGVLKHYQSAPKWYPTHKIKILEDSRLSSIFSVNEVRVNSFHHQAVAEVARGFKVSAVSRDNVIEAIEAIDSTFILGVQWHPECMWQNDHQSFGLFKEFVEAAKRNEG